MESDHNSQSNAVIQINDPKHIYTIAGDNNSITINSHIQQLVVNGNSNNIQSSVESSINQIKIIGNLNRISILNCIEADLIGEDNYITKNGTTTINDESHKNTIIIPPPMFDFSFPIRHHHMHEHEVNSLSISSLGSFSMASNTVHTSTAEVANIATGNTYSHNVVTINLLPHFGCLPPITVYNGVDIDCSICLDKIMNADKIRRLKCNHIFHSLCIEKWITESAICPLCKKEL